jgi:hypothetical protein
MNASTPVLESGNFVRVREDHPDWWRAGRDAMVSVVDTGDGTVGLFFGYDRYNQPQGCECVGTELWHLSELDLTTVH